MKKIVLSILLLFGSLCFSQAVNGNITAAASSCTAGVCVSMQLPANAGTAAIALSGTFSATVQFEGTSQSNANYVALACTPIGAAAPATSAMAAGVWSCNVSGLTDVRVRGSSYSSGTVAVTITNSPAATNSRSGILTGSAATLGSLTVTGNVTETAGQNIYSTYSQ